MPSKGMSKSKKKKFKKQNKKLGDNKLPENQHDAPEKKAGTEISLTATTIENDSSRLYLRVAPSELKKTTVVELTPERFTTLIRSFDQSMIAKSLSELVNKLDPSLAQTEGKPEITVLPSAIEQKKDILTPPMRSMPGPALPHTPAPTLLSTTARLGFLPAPTIDAEETPTAKKIRENQERLDQLEKKFLALQLNDEQERLKEAQRKIEEDQQKILKQQEAKIAQIQKSMEEFEKKKFQPPAAQTSSGPSPGPASGTWANLAAGKGPLAAPSTRGGLVTTGSPHYTDAWPAPGAGVQPLKKSQKTPAREEDRYDYRRPSYGYGRRDDSHGRREGRPSFSRDYPYDRNYYSGRGSSYGKSYDDGRYNSYNRNYGYGRDYYEKNYDSHRDYSYGSRDTERQPSVSRQPSAASAASQKSATATTLESEKKAQATKATATRPSDFTSVDKKASGDITMFGKNKKVAAIHTAPINIIYQKKGDWSDAADESNDELTPEPIEKSVSKLGARK